MVVESGPGQPVVWSAYQTRIVWIIISVALNSGAMGPYELTRISLQHGMERPTPRCNH